MALQLPPTQPRVASEAAARADVLRPAAARAPRTSDEHRRLVHALADPVAWATAAGALLADLGFRLVPPLRRGGPHHLLVALRDHPTLRHFDPEGFAYYTAAAEHSALVCLRRATLVAPPARAPRRVLWGHVHVQDRLPVENRFLTFGGDLRIAALDDDVTILDLASPAPIVRWGGHSQGTDPLADAIGAFFARLMVPIDFVPGMEAHIGAVPAEVLFRAFLLDAAARSTRTARAGIEPTALDRWVVTAWRHAREDAEACRAAEDLLVELGQLGASA